MSNKTPSRAKTWWHGYIEKRARQVWGWSPERKAAKERASVGYGAFQCEQCHAKGLARKDIQIDHIEEVNNPAGWDGWDALLTRLFCPASGLMVMCLPCHKVKTNENQKLRRAARKASKESKS